MVVEPTTKTPPRPTVPTGKSQLMPKSGSIAPQQENIQPTQHKQEDNAHTSEALSPSINGGEKPETTETTEVSESAIKTKSKRKADFSGFFFAAEEGSNQTGGSWCKADSTTFLVRAPPDYKINKNKEKSSEAFYELVGTDLWKTTKKCTHIARKCQLPDTSVSSVDGVPAMLVFNAMWPNYCPPNPIWGAAQDDGEGLSLVMYYELSAAGRQAIEKKTNAARLLQNFIATACHPDKPGHTEYTERLKLIARIMNPTDVKGLSRLQRGLLGSYNAKPCLTRPQHSFYQADNYFEIDVDIHTWCYAVKKGIHGMLQMIETMVIEVGLTIEGSANDELPEQMLCCARLNNLDYTQASYLEER